MLAKGNQILFRRKIEMKKEGLKAKDFITVGIFTALLLVVEFACGMLGFIHPYIVASYVVMIPLVGSIPMMLLITEKHYASAFRFLVLYGIALAFLFGLLSEGSTGLILNCICLVFGVCLRQVY